MAGNVGGCFRACKKVSGWVGEFPAGGEVLIPRARRMPLPAASGEMLLDAGERQGGDAVGEAITAMCGGGTTPRPRQPTCPSLVCARSKAGRAWRHPRVFKTTLHGTVSMGRVTKATSVPTENTSLLPRRGSARG